MRSSSSRSPVLQFAGSPVTPAIEITTSLDTEYGLDKQAVAALSQWRFEPGLKDGKHVPVRVNIEMRFRLKKSQAVERRLVVSAASGWACSRNSDAHI